MLPDMFFLSLLFTFPDCFKISRGNRFFRMRVDTTISSAHKHLHLTKTKKLTVATNLGLVMDNDHSYHQKSWSTKVRRMLLGISRKPSITYTRMHSLSISAAQHMDSEFVVVFFSSSAYHCGRNVLKTRYILAF